VRHRNGGVAVAKLVYIGGYGRSGSTLLEYLLAAHPEVVACGEIARHLRSFAKHNTCSCGKPMQACPVWGEFQRKSGRLEGLDHEQLGLALFDHVSDRYEVMVDSSKTAWGSTLMPFRMSKRLGKDFLLIHLVRDPRAVAWSTIRPPRRQRRTRKRRQHSSPGARSLRTAAGWTIANLACEMFDLLHPDRYLLIRYEDLVREPLKTIGQIFARVTLEPPANFDHLQAPGNRHQLYGNAMRFETLSSSDVKEDAAWKTAMPNDYRWLIGRLCWPLCLRYDYGLRADARESSEG
jgi:Sulfotransferase family